MPLPMPYLRHILAVLNNIVAMIGKLVVHSLTHIGCMVAELRDPVDHVNNQLKTVELFSTAMSKGVVVVPSSL
jgi:hypothetical protein